VASNTFSIISKDLKKKTKPNRRRQNRKKASPARSRRSAHSLRTFLANVTVTLRKSILDPQGKAVEHAIGMLNVGAVSGVRVGKHIEMMIEARNRASAQAIAETVCKKLLANPVMEDYHVEIAKQ
jgi:phosphoribosylformylglycinamidine synthase